MEDTGKEISGFDQSSVLEDLGGAGSRECRVRGQFIKGIRQMHSVANVIV